MSINKLWVERYRPNTISNIVFANAKERDIFNQIVQSDQCPNLLLIGPQGTGKTSISWSLVKDLKIDPCDILKINCSDEQIECIREKVKSFAYTMPVGKYKVVRLEEMCYLSQPAQALLRVLIEEVSHSCRFIATANYINKILPAIRSRFQEHNISTPDKYAIFIRMAEILVQEDINFEIDDLEKVIAAAYPDMRKMLQILEASSRTGTLIIGDSNPECLDWKLNLLTPLKSGDFVQARKIVCSSATREELIDIYRFVYNNLNHIFKRTDLEDEAVRIIAQYQYQHAFVADPEIQIAAMFIELAALCSQ
jgi:DNA polymerase III delta prime subunit